VSQSVSSPDWQVLNEGKATMLVVQTRKDVTVFPLFRLLYSRGDNTTVTLAFDSHDVILIGQGLAAVLAALAAERLIRLIEPSENEANFKFRGAAANKYDGPAIDRITVKTLSEKA